MRSSSPALVALLALWAVNGLAQDAAVEELRELMCEQCPYDAPVRIYPRSAITPDMRNLGIVPVRDMIDQPPASPSFKLGSSISRLREIGDSYGIRTLTLLNSKRMSEKNNDESESPAEDDEPAEDSSDSGDPESAEP